MTVPALGVPIAWHVHLLKDHLHNPVSLHDTFSAPQLYRHNVRCPRKPDQQTRR